MQSGNNLLDKLTKEIGSIDARLLMQELQEFGINDFEIVENGIKISIASVSDLNKLKEALQNVSKVGRTFEVTSDLHMIFIDTLKLKESHHVNSRNPFTKFSDRQHIEVDPKHICAGECKHFQHGDQWVANRNILFYPDGQYVVLNNPTHPNNTITANDIKNYLSLGKDFKQIGHLSFTKQGDSLLPICSSDEFNAKLDPLVKKTIEDRAKKEVPIILDKGYAEKVSHEDFYHGHPIADPDNPKDIYILYHTFETTKPSLKFKKDL